MVVPQSLLVRYYDHGTTPSEIPANGGSVLGLLLRVCDEFANAVHPNQLSTVCFLYCE